MLIAAFATTACTTRKGAGTATVVGLATMATGGVLAAVGDRQAFAIDVAIAPCLVAPSGRRL